MRRSSPEGTRLLFAGTVSPMICPVDGPAERQHKKIRRKTRRRGKRQSYKNETSSPMSSWWWVKDDTRDQREGRDEGQKAQSKIEHRVTQPTQSGRVRGGTIDLTGYSAPQQTKNIYYSAVSSSRWGSKLEKRLLPRFGGFFQFRNRPSCCCYNSYKAAPLRPPPRP